MTSDDKLQWFEAEVESLLPGLLATARRLTKDQADAEDLVADALVKALNHLDSLRDRAALRGWLCRILTNTFLSRRRTDANRPDAEPYMEEAGDDETFSLFDRLHQPFLLWQSNPERDFLNRLLREEVGCAIDCLPEAFRIVVTLVDVQGLSYQEVATALDVPVGTVRSRLARGRSLLQKALWTQAVDVGLKGPAQESDQGGMET